MTYALVISGVIQSTRNTPPPAARRLDTGAWVTPLDGVWTAPLAAACGWLPVTVVTRPADTATHTSDTVLTAGTHVCEPRITISGNVIPAAQFVLEAKATATP